MAGPKYMPLLSRESSPTSDFSFHPTINNTSQELAKKRHGGANGHTFLDNMGKEVERMERRREEIRQQVLEERQRKYPFEPQLRDEATLGVRPDQLIPAKPASLTTHHHSPAVLKPVARAGSANSRAYPVLTVAELAARQANVSGGGVTLHVGSSSNAPLIRGSRSNAQ